MYIFKLYWNKKKRWNMCATEICTQNVLVSNALSLRTVYTAISYVSRSSWQHFRNDENEQWTMLLCFVLCELKFKRFVWSHFAQQQYKYQHKHTTTMEERTNARKLEREKETQIHLWHWFDCCCCCCCCHSHIYMIWIVWQLHGCIVLCLCVCFGRRASANVLL